MRPNHPDSPVPAPGDPDYPEKLPRIVGRRLLRERVKLGLSAAEVSRRTDGKLSDQAILNNEAGGRNLGLVTVGHHFQALGVTVQISINGVIIFPADDP
jgi:transcriptional regulator with XRE-family HTH domain